MTQGPVIVDAGPLIALSLAECLEVLKGLFGRVLVPEAVFREVVEKGAGRVGSREVAGANFIDRFQLTAAPDPLLARALGLGEAEVIALGHQRHAKLVLIDDRRARRIASQAYGLRVKGTAGILVAAKSANLIAEIRPFLEKMTKHGYFLSTRLFEMACREVGED